MVVSSRLEEIDQEPSFNISFSSVLVKMKNLFGQYLQEGSFQKILVSIYMSSDHSDGSKIRFILSTKWSNFALLVALSKDGVETWQHYNYCWSNVFCFYFSQCFDICYILSTRKYVKTWTKPIVELSKCWAQTNTHIT